MKQRYPQAGPMLDANGQPVQVWRQYLKRLEAIDDRVAANVAATGTADEKIDAVLAAMKAAGLMEVDD